MAKPRLMLRNRKEETIGRDAKQFATRLEMRTMTACQGAMLDLTLCSTPFLDWRARSGVSGAGLRNTLSPRSMERRSRMEAPHVMSEPSIHSFGAPITLISKLNEGGTAKLAMPWASWAR